MAATKKPQNECIDHIADIIPDSRPHYIDNQEFTRDVVRFVTRRQEMLDEGLTPPKIPDTIGRQFLEIATRLARRPNFYRYTYIDEMILDGVTDCIKACKNFNSEYSSNAFSYFTTIIYWAFVRRIKKENRERDLRQKFLEESFPSEFYTMPGELFTEEEDEEQLEYSTSKNVSTSQEYDDDSDEYYLQLEQNMSQVEQRLNEVARQFFDEGRLLSNSNQDRQFISDNISKFNDETIYRIHQDFYAKTSG